MVLSAAIGKGSRGLIQQTRAFRDLRPRSPLLWFRSTLITDSRMTIGKWLLRGCPDRSGTILAVMLEFRQMPRDLTTRKGGWEEDEAADKDRNKYEGYLGQRPGQPSGVRSDGPVQDKRLEIRIWQ